MYKKIYTITPDQLEAGYNHLNHAAVLTLLEKARLDYLIEIGIPNETLHERGHFLVIAGISVRYLREIFAGEVIVSIESIEASGKEMIIDQKAYNPKNKVLAEARYDFRVIDAKEKRSVPIPSDIREAMTKGLPAAI